MFKNYKKNLKVTHTFVKPLCKQNLFVILLKIRFNLIRVLNKIIFRLSLAVMFERLKDEVLHQN